VRRRELVLLRVLNDQGNLAAEVVVQSSYQLVVHHPVARKRRRPVDDVLGVHADRPRSELAEGSFEGVPVVADSDVGDEIGRVENESDLTCVVTQLVLQP
jgi:hypothetical protein